MNIHDTDELIDLGAASVETQGNGKVISDLQGLIPEAGISDD